MKKTDFSQLRSRGYFEEKGLGFRMKLRRGGVGGSDVEIILYNIAIYYILYGLFHGLVHRFAYFFFQCG